MTPPSPGSKKLPILLQQHPSENREKLIGDSTPQEKGGAQYLSRSLFKKIFNVLLRSHLIFFGTSGHITRLYKSLESGNGTKISDKK